jgi:hypothetical protein
VGWTWDDVRYRNSTIFGTPEPAGQSDAPEEKVEDRPERLIALECSKVLSEDGWRLIPCEPISARSRGRGFGEVGMPDLLCLRYGRQGTAECLWIEWKGPSGRLQKHQQEWHTKERARGALTAIAGVDFKASVTGFRSWYATSGLQRAGL